jgi:hypothetical protein
METGIAQLTPEMLAFIGTGGVNAIAPFTREIFLLQVTVAGTSFCKNIEELAPQLTKDTKMRMLRHPKNEHDEMAIGIYLNENRVGWVPLEENEVISRLMDAGKAFFCRITDTRKKGNWHKIDVDIYMVE